MIRSRLWAGTAVAALTMTAMAARAQPVSPGPALPEASEPTVQATSGTSVPAQTGQATAGGSTLQEVVVTAQRRSESIQKVPITVTAVNAVQIQNLGLSNVESLALVTPALVSGSQVGYGQPYIRGVGSDIVTVGTESSVSLYVDGIYQSQNQALLSNLSNVERVEILEGPQGALYGRNATGGDINIVTKEPKPGLTGDLELGGGSYGAVESKGYVAGGNDFIDGSFAFYTLHHDGYIKNLLTGNNVDKADDWGYAGKIVIHPTSIDKITLATDYGNTGPDTGAYAEQFGTNNVTASIFPGAQYTSAPHKVYNNEYGIFDKTRTYSFSAHYTHSFDAFDANVLGGYRNTSAKSSVDVDASSIPFIYFAEPIQYTHDYSIEANVVSHGSGPFTWLAGVNYFVTDGYSDNFIDVIGQEQVITIAHLQTQATAGFAQAGYRFGPGDRIQVIGDLRYTHEKRSIGGQQDIYVGPGDDSGPPVLAIPGFNHTTFNNLSGSGTVKYAFTPDINAYVKYSTAFKSGSYNAVQPNDPVLGPETIKAYEGGFKSDLLDHKVRVNGAGFYYDYSNLQVGQITDTGGILYANAASAHVYGGELETEYQALRNLVLTLSGTYLDATYQSFLAGSDLSLLPGVVGGVPGNYPAPTLGLPAPNLAGNRLSHAPKFSGSFGANYKLATDFGQFELNGIARYTDLYYFDIGNQLKNPANIIVNLSVTYHPTGHENYYIRAYADNVSQADYFAYKARTSSGDFGNYGDPRTYGVAVGVHF